MEASALRAPAGISRVPLALPLLRLRSDDQLLALFRSGSEDAFAVLHDRYRQRLFAYVRQMLSTASRQDAEDVMQDVFVRAYGALRADRRAVNVRAWLYRVAHNRCIDHLRRPTPPAAELFDLSRKPLLDPIEEAQRREDLSRLVEDIGRLPEQQRSALLMREIDGMSYADMAGALTVTVPAVKSLLVRARIGLVEAAEARDADCAEIRQDLVSAYDRGVKASGRARRHMRGCEGCREYRAALRGMRRSFAALSPVAAGPLAIGAKLLGLGGAGGGAAAGGSAAAGGGAAAVGGVATVSACKVAAVVCTAALTAGGAVEVHRLTRDRDAQPRPAAKAAAPAPDTRAVAAPAPVAPEIDRPVARPTPHHPASIGEQQRTGKPPAKSKPSKKEVPITAPVEVSPAPTEAEAPAPPAPTEAPSSGGTQAPDPPAEAPAGTGTAPAPAGTAPATPPESGGGTAPGSAEPAPGSATPPVPPGGTPPPDEH